MLLQPEHWTRLQDVVQRRVLRYFHTHELLDELDARDMLSWQGSGGFSIDASVRIERDDRAGLERLLRYRARPPFVLERLHALAGVASLASPDARLLYRFPKPTPDRRTEIVLSPLQLLQRLVAFVPPRRACTATATTASSRPTPVRAPPPSPSAEPRPRHAQPCRC